MRVNGLFCFLFLLGLVTTQEIEWRQDLPEVEGRVNKQKLAEETESIDELRSYLLDDYENNTPPGKTVVIFELNVQFLELLGVEDSTGTVRILTYVLYSWYDPRLEWDPQDFSNLTVLSLDIGSAAEEPETFVPEFSFHPVNGQITNLDFTSLTYVVDYTGVVSINSVASTPFFCGLDFQHFPFDSNICRTFVVTNFPSVLQQGFLAGDLPSTLQDMTLELPEGSNDVQHMNSRSPVLPGLTADVFFFDWQITRSPDQYYLRYIIPTALFTFISFATFTLEANTGDRIGVCLTALLSIVALNFVIVGLIPGSSTTTFIDIFTLVSIFFALFATLESGMSLYLYQQDRKIPSSISPSRFFCGKSAIFDGDFEGSKEQVAPKQHMNMNYETYRELVLWLVENTGRVSLFRFLTEYDPDTVIMKVERVNYHRKIAQRTDVICLIVVPLAYIGFLIGYIISANDNVVGPHFN